MANSLNQDVRGKVVVLRREAFGPEYQDIKYRLFKVTGGFGAVGFTIGRALCGTHIYDDENARWDSYAIERLATDKEIAAVIALKTETTIGSS